MFLTQGCFTKNGDGKIVNIASIAGLTETPMRRAAKPEETEEIVLFLSSDAASTIFLVSHVEKIQLCTIQK